MVFNVVDRECRHLGVIANPYDAFSGLCMVALTSTKAEEVLQVDQEGLKRRVAIREEATNLFGGVNEEKLREVVEKAEEEFSFPQQWNYESKIAFIVLKQKHPEIRECLRLVLPEEDVNGFLTCTDYVFKQRGLSNYRRKPRFGRAARAGGSRGEDSFLRHLPGLLPVKR